MNKRKFIIERIIITGETEERAKANAYLEANDFHVLRSGPMPVAGHKFDTSRFKIIAEREIKKPTATD